MPAAGPSSVNTEIRYFASGVQNLLDDEVISGDAASDASNWYTQDGVVKLAGGRLLIGTEGTVGQVSGESFGYRIDGTTIHWAKFGTTIKYWNDSTSAWVAVITGLSATADYTFSNYQSLAGAFTIFSSPDGLYKVNNASPGNAINLYDQTKNFKGYSFVDSGRMIMWGLTKDPTGLYGSWIDRQDGTYYQTISAESLGTGNGSTKTFTGTLAFASSAVSNAFGVQVYAGVTNKVNITSATQAPIIGVGVSSIAGYSIGDQVEFNGVGGMTQLNGTIGTIVSVGTLTLNIAINSSAFTAYTSGGTLAKVEYFTDNFLGVLTSNLGGTGTINYVTGAYSVSFNTAPLNAYEVGSNYQVEDSNSHGITDFTHDEPRTAGQGFQFPQDEGGDPIVTVLIGPDGYYSLKSQSAYLLTIGADDLTATNVVYRKQLGIQSLRGAIASQQGIFFMNTANPEKPGIVQLQKNSIGTAFEPVPLFPEFKFANYEYDDCCIVTYERYFAVMCKSIGANENDTILLCDLTPKENKVNIISYAARTGATDSGNIYIGSPITMSVYQLFSGFDDDGLAIENFWESRGELFQPHLKRFIPALLKKHRYLRLQGLISREQSYAVYISYDDAGYQLVGTVLGTADYVDYTSPQAIGSNVLGGVTIGGGTGAIAYNYFMQIKMRKVPKFMKRKVRIVALGIGYADFNYIGDFGLMFYENKIPSRFRSKQNVSLDGTETDLPQPQY